MAVDVDVEKGSVAAPADAAIVSIDREEALAVASDAMEEEEAAPAAAAVTVMLVEGDGLAAADVNLLLVLPPAALGKRSGEVCLVFTCKIDEVDKNGDRVRIGLLFAEPVTSGCPGLN